MQETHSEQQLKRHFGLLQATALNLNTMVGAGIFITLPLMLRELPGPYALLGWIVGGALIIVDGLIWAELGATMPGSGGTYLYLLECYGRNKAGRLMAFLFIWQFLISGPLEASTALIAIAVFSLDLFPAFKTFNAENTVRFVNETTGLAISIGPSRIIGIGVGLFLIFLLYRRTSSLGKLTVTFGVGLLAAIAVILISGAVNFDPDVAFNYSGAAAETPSNFGTRLGQAMVLAIYCYLGYYNVCYIGDEVREPGKTIPRSIILSSILICILYMGLHLAMLGTVPWQSIPTDDKSLEQYSLAASFMNSIYGSWGGTIVSLFLIWASIGSAFSLLLGYSRIPYGAAVYGHFFSVFKTLHPVHAIPHISLFLVGGLTLLWSFFDLGAVITAMIVTRVLEQFIGQVIGVMILRKTQPNRPRPFRIYLYPMPCLLALAGWLYVYFTSEGEFIVLGLVTLAAGTIVYLIWASLNDGWPFGHSEDTDEGAPLPPIDMAH